MRVNTGVMLPLDTPIEGAGFVMPRYRKRAETSLFDEAGGFTLAPVGVGTETKQKPKEMQTKVEHYQEQMKLAKQM